MSRGKEKKKKKEKGEEEEEGERGRILDSVEVDIYLVLES